MSLSILAFASNPEIIGENKERRAKNAPPCLYLQPLPMQLEA